MVSFGTLARTASRGTPCDVQRCFTYGLVRRLTVPVDIQRRMFDSNSAVFRLVRVALNNPRERWSPSQNLNLAIAASGVMKTHRIPDKKLLAATDALIDDVAASNPAPFRLLAVGAARCNIALMRQAIGQLAATPQNVSPVSFLRLFVFTASRRASRDLLWSAFISSAKNSYRVRVQCSEDLVIALLTRKSRQDLQDFLRGLPDSDVRCSAFAAYLTLHAILHIKSSTTNQALGAVAVDMVSARLAVEWCADMCWRHPVVYRYVVFSLLRQTTLPASSVREVLLKRPEQLWTLVNQFLQSRPRHTAAGVIATFTGGPPLPQDVSDRLLSCCPPALLLSAPTIPGGRGTLHALRTFPRSVGMLTSSFLRFDRHSRLPRIRCRLHRIFAARSRRSSACKLEECRWKCCAPKCLKRCNAMCTH